MIAARDTKSSHRLICERQNSDLETRRRIWRVGHCRYHHARRRSIDWTEQLVEGGRRTANTWIQRQAAADGVARKGAVCIGISLERIGDPFRMMLTGRLQCGVMVVRRHRMLVVCSART